MDEQSGPIQGSPDYLRRLRELVHSRDELQKAGYVLGQLSPSDLDRKRRCERCHRAIAKKSERQRALPGKTLAAPANGNRPPVTPEKRDGDVITAAAEESRNNKEVERVLKDLTTENDAPAKAAEPLLRCKFHPGTVARGKWTCCNSHVLSKPCKGEENHEPRRYSSGELEDNWKYHATSPAPPRSRPAAAVVIDCEMGVADSGESELIRVSVIDYLSRRVLLDSLVWPSVKMAHFSTRFSGITRQMMDNARRRNRCLLGRDRAREAVLRFVGPETVVVGHAGQGDLISLRWIHTVIVDTLIMETKIRRREQEIEEAAKAEAAIRLAERAEDASDSEKKESGEEPSAPRQEGGLSLKALALKRLNRHIQIRGRGHDSVEDALATRDLLHWHITESMW